MGLLKRLKKLFRDERGNALAMGAAAMPMVIAGAGLALDTIQISLAKRQLQRSADSAALAGAHAIVQDREAGAAVTRDLQLNNEVTLSGAPVVQNAPQTGPFTGNPRAVRVQLSANRSLSFLSFFTSAEQAITVEATAAVVVEGEFCMLSLEDGTDTGVTLSGNAEVNIGCGISSNSRAAEAIRATGSSTIIASPIMAVGGVPSSNNYASGTQIVPYASVQDDPYAHLPDPAPTNCQPKLTVSPNASATIGPGEVCYNGLDIKGTLNIATGTTIMVNGNGGGDLSFGSQARVTGSSVTFVLTSTNATSNPSSVAESIAELDINGGAQMNLTAPTSGTYSGVLFYQDRRAPLGRTIRFNGNSSSDVQGAFYFPRSYLQFNGTTGMTTRCIQLVARRLEFSGNGQVLNQCPPGTANRGFTGQYVRLVG